MKQHYLSGVPWESQVGYARAVRVGSVIHVSGTTATGDNGEIVGVGDYYLQTQQCLRNIEKALKGLGAGFEHVVRTRVFVKDIGQWAAVGKAHGEVFGEIKPASAMYQISALINPQMLVEIEAEAILDV